MKHVYLLFTIAGAVVPYIFFVDFFMAEGLALPTFISALFANGAAGGFSADVLLSSAVFWIYLFSNGTPRAWIYVVLNLTIGLSCALPAYLYAREAEKDRQVVALGA